MFWQIFLVLGFLLPTISFREPIVGKFLRMIRITERRRHNIPSLSWSLIKAQRSMVLMNKMSYVDDGDGDDEARRQKKRIYKKRLSTTVSNFRTEQWMDEMDDSKKNSGIDERIPFDRLESKKRNYEVVMNITRFSYLMEVLKQLESPDIGDIQKMRIIEKYIRDESPAIYANNITAGGLFRDWDDDKKYWWDM